MDPSANDDQSTDQEPSGDSPLLSHGETGATNQPPRKSNDTFYHLIQDAPFGVYVVDSQLVIRQVSAGSRRAFGAVDPVVGRDLSEVLHILWPAPFATSAVARFKQTLQTGKPYISEDTTEARGDRDAVESYHWELRRVALPDGTHGVVCYFYDITRIRQAELNSRESEQRMRLAAEVAKMGVVTVQYADDSVTLDSVAASLFEMPADRPTTREELHARFHPDDRIRFEQMIAEALTSARADGVAMEGRVRSGQGAWRWINFRKRIFFETRGDGVIAPTHAILAAVDITEQKQFESQLLKAKDAAEAANRTRGEFLANMSHEIRTPMAAILGHADMLLTHLKDPDNRQCVATIKRNGEHLLDVINDILDLSRLEANKLSIDLGPCELCEVLADIKSLMEVRVDNRPIDFRVRTASMIPRIIHTDVTRLKQVLLNLVGNAIKFTESGHVEIRVEYLAPDRSLRVAIEDTGIGIAPDRIEALFQPFSQGDASVTRRYGGSGLGLTISKHIAELLGGELLVASELGKGSTFTLILPIGMPDDPSLIDFDGDSGVAAVGGVEPTPQLACRVLLVDDRRDVRYVAQHFLEEAGAEVRTAKDGELAIQAYRDGQQSDSPFDIIIMDMQMPNVDGYTATAQLRSDGCHLPIIALTAAAMRGDRERCLDAGCDDYLSKPLSAIPLVQMVARYTQDVSQEELSRLRSERQPDAGVE
ncbi:MAG: response regulator [Planctomycetales bacterium]|nr:response regulator [Planctomycetales bacterium]